MKCFSACFGLALSSPPFRPACRCVDAAVSEQPGCRGVRSGEVGNS